MIFHFLFWKIIIRVLHIAFTKGKAGERRVCPQEDMTRKAEDSGPMGPICAYPDTPSGHL
jgi:hypothetical protein